MGGGANDHAHAAPGAHTYTVPVVITDVIADMALYIWGFGKYGQLGNGATANAEVPQLVKFPSGFHPEKVSCGGHFTAVLCGSTRRKKAEGTGSAASGGTPAKRVFACGWGKYGRLGTGTEEDQAVPTEVRQCMLGLG